MHLDFAPESLGKGSAELGHGALIPVIPVIAVIAAAPRAGRLAAQRESRGGGRSRGRAARAALGTRVSTGGLQKAFCGWAFCSLTPGNSSEVFHLPEVPGKSFPHSQHAVAWAVLGKRRSPPVQ